MSLFEYFDVCVHLILQIKLTTCVVPEIVISIGRPHARTTNKHFLDIHETLFTRTNLTFLLLFFTYVFCMYRLVPFIKSKYLQP
jgi:hypothetical protein